MDLQELKDSPSDQLPGFNERLMAWLPTMIEHRCSVGERGGFFERLRRGTWQGHILEHVTLELQTLAGTPVGFGRARETSEEGVYKVVVEYKEEELARACMATAFELCQAAIHDRPFDMAAEVQKLRDLAQKVCLGPSTGAIVAAARNRGIPVRRLNSDSLVQLGYGARQHRILAAETDRTGAIAESIAQDKELTRMLLRTVGVPVPEGRPVTDAEDAWAAARDIGHPGGGQAAVRQPRPRRDHEPDHPRAGDQPPMRPRRKNSAASWSSGSLPGPTIACWSWATKSWPRPAASRLRWSATASPPLSISSRKSTATRAAATITPRYSPRSSSKRSRWPRWPNRVLRPTRSRRPACACSSAAMRT